MLVSPTLATIDASSDSILQLLVSSGASKTLIVFEEVWNRGMTVAAVEALNKGGTTSTIASGNM